MNARTLALFFTASTVGAFALAACSSAAVDDAPTRTPIPTATAPATSTTSPEASTPPDPSCVGSESCYKCEPVELVQFLNACTDGRCVKFDNAARLPLYKAGEPLPPVP